VNHLHDEIELDVDLFDAGNGVLDPECGADDEGVLDVLFEALKALQEAFKLFLPRLRMIQLRVSSRCGLKYSPSP